MIEIGSSNLFLKFQSDQLRLQENEMQNLKVSLKLQQEENRHLKEAKETFESEREMNQRYGIWNSTCHSEFPISMTIQAFHVPLYHYCRSTRQELENLQKQNKNLKNELDSEKKIGENITKVFNLT